MKYRDAATRETWYKGTWYDEEDPEQMAALKEREELDAEMKVEHREYERNSP